MRRPATLAAASRAAAAAAAAAARAAAAAAASSSSSCPSPVPYHSPSSRASRCACLYAALCFCARACAEMWRCEQEV